MAGNQGVGPTQAAMRQHLEMLQPVEDVLLDQGFDEVIVQTQNGSFTWRTVAREAELDKVPEGGEPTEEEYDMAVRLIADSPQDHVKLSESIAREFARRRLARDAG